MKLTFIGADHEVTGSCHCLSACGKNILVDYGMEQGENPFINATLPVPCCQIDYVFLTHAHIDHSGLLPLLCKNGFSGQIFSTKATADLCGIMLRDSAHIQEFEAEWKNRKGKRAGEEEVFPLYDMNDAEKALSCFQPVDYEEIVNVCPGIRIRFRDVGHLLGSSSIEVWLSEEGTEKKIVFSGDIGNIRQPLIKDPKYVTEADYVVMESTYGDRLHGQRPDYIGSLSKIIKETFDRKGNLIIPSFAVGRTQEILYFIRQIKQEGLLPEYPDFDVYVDSPLAVEATSIFQKNVYSCFDQDALDLINQGINPISFPGLKLSVTSDDSKAINFDPDPKIIISASGMCEAGRIRHHLKHNLWRQECTVLFVGYQAHGTLGRSLVEGAKTVRLFGETIEVKAHVEILAGISGHADKDGLIRWLSAIQKKPEQVFIVHGEDIVCDAFAAELSEKYGYQTSAPYSGSVYDLREAEYVTQAVPVPLRQSKPATKRADQVFARLLAAGQRLLCVIRKQEGCANKDIARFADQITSLCDKWDRQDR